MGISTIAFIVLVIVLVGLIVTYTTKMMTKVIFWIEMKNNRKESGRGPDER